MITQARQIASRGHRMNYFTRCRNMQWSALKTLLLVVWSQFASIVEAEGLGVTVYTNGQVYTVNEAAPWAEAITISADGVFLAVGTEQQALKAAEQAAGNNSDYSIIDLQQRLVLPGFHDVHIHAVEAGINAQICYMEAEVRPRDLAKRLKSCKDQASFGGAGWIVGVGPDIGLLQEYIYNDLSEPLPIAVLDEAYPDTPVVILDSIGHGAVINTEALRQVGLLDVTTPISGGQILRDTDGSPFGIVLENVQQVFRDAAFPPTPENQLIAYNSLLDALKTLNSNGITSVSDAGGFWRQAQTESWARALEENQLTVRASNALYVYPDTDLAEQLPELLSRYSNDKDSTLRFNQAKVYVDGILELATAALYEPYLDSLELTSDQSLGFEYFGSVLNDVTQQLAANGFQLHFHVVGDRAAGLALDAIESIVKDTSGGPHRLTHCYLVDERDRPRFAQLGVVADFQLAPSSLDPEYLDFLANDIIGSTLANQLLPAKEIYDTGALVTLSSDWDADEISPILKIQTVLENGIFSSVEEVIPLMTINAAELLQQDDKTGSIEVGKYADLVVLDKNIFELPFSRIGESRVAMTIFQGKVVYNSTNSGHREGFIDLMFGFIVSVLTCVLPFI